MISHFQYKQRNKASAQRGWSFSFFHNQARHTGTYHADGSIEWKQLDSESKKDELEKAVHDLMLYHVYEDHSS
ncbi:DUF5342 family protein [Paenalkalicoccus suaedae]|uniref:DUF5342 family protein n=1 Tax=Paenalkalicoccus suaedae TaxID=2592382 RepID=A0A859FDA8_9BACI|nr:DUF5342 family protein [Paenalkalicoccus suaedae]QKS70732.1 DUF5342 family protein [Paenalkalicoccus suaedae]